MIDGQGTDMENGATAKLVLSIRRLVDCHRNIVFFTSIEADIERAPENDVDPSVSDSDDGRTELEVDDREEDSTYSEEGTVDGSEEEDDDEEEVQGVKVRPRRQSRRQAEGIQEESGNAELEDSDSDSDEEEGVRVGGVTHQVGKRKRNEEPVRQVEGTDLKVGDTLEVGSMTWERIEGLDKDSRTVPHFDTKIQVTFVQR